MALVIGANANARGKVVAKIVPVAKMILVARYFMVKVAEEYALS